VEVVRQETLDWSQAPDLLDAFADRKATAFGITGTFRDLANMCPVDLDDPRITLAAKNEFVIKLANESGLEVEAEHEALFAETTERLGLERKFTVMPAEKFPAAERDPPTPHPQRTETKLAVPPAEKQKPEPAEVRTEATSKPESLLTPDEGVSYYEATRLRQDLVEMAAQTGSTIDTPSIVAVDIYTRRSQTQIAEEVIYPAPINSPAADKPHEEIAPVISIYEQPTELMESAEDQASERIARESAQDSLEQVPDTTVSNWAAELYKEPLEIYADFTESLLEFAKQDEQSENQPGKVDVNDLAPEQRVARQVAERLKGLDTDEQLQAAEIMQHIVGAVHGLYILEAQNMAPETIQQVKLQLQELCQSLTEVIGLELSQEEIEHFVRAVIQLEFDSRQPLEEQLEYTALDKRGTREAKYATRFSGSDTDDKNYAQRALGTFTLVCAGLRAYRRPYAI
jgi:hypothetical protein